MTQTTQTTASNGHPPMAGHLTSHRHVTFSGSDAAAFLQGYLTCDTAVLSETQAIPGAFTNLKGRVVANGWFWGQATEVKALVAADVAPILVKFLGPYLNFARTSATVLESLPCVALNALPDTPSDAEAQPVELGRSRWWLPFADHFSADLSSAWLADCIERSEAVVGAEVSGTHLPQMLGLVDLGAVSFDKGCYLGQEVVARAQHRGEVKRRLRRISFTSGPTLTLGSDLTTVEGKKVASVVCATSNAALVVTALSSEGAQEWLAGEQPVSLQLEPLPAST